jgi:hypothetical protein
MIQFLPRMADIIITCAACGNRVTVSEFVSAESLVCMNCKANIPVSTRMPHAPAATGLKLAMLPPPPSAPPHDEPEKKGSRRGKISLAAQAESPTSNYSDVKKFLPSSGRRALRRRSSRMGKKNWSWAVFALLLILLSWMRFWPGALPAQHLSTVILTGVWALFGLHVVVVLYAFDDDPFHGVLSAILPGYSLYYLFVQADQFYLRSLVAALLLVFGWDASLAAQRVWSVAYHDISSWIQDTDTLKTKLPH